MTDPEITKEVNDLVKTIHDKGNYVTLVDIQRRDDGFEVVCRIRHPRREGDEWPADFFLGKEGE